MQKVIIRKYGNRDRLEITTADDLIPSIDEVVVAVEYFGINYADIAIRLGLYESAKKFVGLPITPGFEFSGKVKSVGDNCTRFKKGDEVFGVSLFNSYASEVKVSEEQLFFIPKNVTMEQAAGIPTVFMTAYHGLFQQFKNYPRQKILIHSAAGGVGAALTQLCKQYGHIVYGVVGSTHKIEFCQKNKADFIVDKSRVDLWKSLDELSPDGFDIIFDANGSSTLKEGINRLKPCGKMVSYGFASMLPKKRGSLNYLKLVWTFLKTPKFNPIFMTTKNISLITFNLSFLFDRKDLLKEAMDDLIMWFEKEEIKPLDVTVFDIKDIKSAHELIESGQSVGKIIVKTTDQ